MPGTREPLDRQMPDPWEQIRTKMPGGVRGGGMVTHGIDSRIISMYQTPLRNLQLLFSAAILWVSVHLLFFSIRRIFKPSYANPCFF